MADPVVWDDLPRSQTDPETIDEAIAAGIDAHNADTNAHMGTDEAIQQHRLNEIIDHPAESIPNDKVTILPRRFVAIVDPTDSEEFDTIEAAVTAAVAAGGGQIRIVGGTHEIAADITIPPGVFLVGEPDNSTVVTNDASGTYSITFQRFGDPTSILYGAQNITFLNDNNDLILFEDGSGVDDNVLKFIDCQFLYAGNTMQDPGMYLVFDGCYFDLQTSAFIDVASRFKMNECTAGVLTGQSYGRIATGGATQATVSDIIITDCQFLGKASVANALFHNMLFDNAQINSNKFTNYDPSTNDFDDSQIVGNNIHMSASVWFELNSYNTLLSGNVFTGGTGNRVRLGAVGEDNVIVGNVVGTPVTVDVGANVVNNNTGDYSPAYLGFYAYSGGQTINASTWTKVTQSEAPYNPSGAWASSKFTAPCKGFYHFDANVLTAAGSSRNIIALYKNGSLFQWGDDVESNGPRGLSVAANMDLDEGDYVEVYYYSTNGSDLVTSGFGDSNFSGFLIGRIAFGT